MYRTINIKWSDLKKLKFNGNLICIASILWFFSLILLPTFGIIRETLRQGANIYSYTFQDPMALQAFFLTLKLTVGSILLNTFFGVIIALVLVKDDFKGKLFLSGLIDLPFAVSPVIAGFMFLLLFGPAGWLGSWFESHQIKIVYAFPGMLIATLFVTMPFVVREVVPVLKECSQEQEEAAYILGATRWQTFWKVTLPSIKWGLVYGITLTVARSIGEFGAVLVVSGSIINQTQTATLRIHDQFTDFNYAGAFSASLILAIFSFLIITLMQKFSRRREV